MDDPNIEHKEKDIYYTEVGKQDDRIYIGVVSLYKFITYGFVQDKQNVLDVILMGIWLQIWDFVNYEFSM